MISSSNLSSEQAHDSKLSLILVQASSRSWTGGHDLSVSLVEGAPAFIQTIRNVQAVFTKTPVTVIAPEYDKDGEIGQWLSDYLVPQSQVSYNFDHSPLKRMIAATQDLSDEAYVMRINGLNLFVDRRIILEMLEMTTTSASVDCCKMTDDYPAALSVDIYRVGALRKALTMLPQDDIYHVHVKYFMASHPEDFNVKTYPSKLYYTQAEMTAFKQRLQKIYEIEHTEVQEKYALHTGDQLQLHYELALKWMRPNSKVLDIGCGTGFGGAYLAEHGHHVICGDLDEVALTKAQKRYAEIANLEIRYMNAEKTGLADNSIDFITSFETIEHIDNVPAYLQEFSRILKPNGLAFFSTPQNCFGEVPLTYWHHIEYSYEQLKTIIESTFEVVDFIGIKQGRIYYPNDPIGNNSFVIAKPRKVIPS